VSRLFVLVLALFLVAAAAAWFADHPGRVVLQWQGWRLETSAALLMLAAAALMVAAVALNRLWRWLAGGPGAIGAARAEQRRRRGYESLTKGLVAVAAGDPRQARSQARRASSLLAEAPLTRLLAAQAAQLEGDESAARRHFNAMVENPETEFLGLRGLLALATRRGDRETALELARRARELRPDSPWVLDTLFRLEAAEGRWIEAEGTLAQAARRKLVDAAESRRRKALVAYARALKAGDGDPREALDQALKSHDAAPDFAPATALAARLLSAAGKARKAARLIETGWTRAPHPDLAAAFLKLRPEETAAARLARFRKLAALNSAHPESRIAAAELALAAGQWDEARAALEALGAAPDARVCRLMAELEERQHGDLAAAREWLGRAALAPPGPAWVCDDCGAASGEWLAHCPACEAFGSLRWAPPKAAPAAGRLAPPESDPAPPAEAAQAAALPAPAPALAPALATASAQVGEAPAVETPPVVPEVPPPPDVPAPPGGVDEERGRE